MSDGGSRPSCTRPGAEGHAGRRPTGRRLAVAAVLALLAAAAGCFAPPSRSGSDARTVRIVSHELAEGESLESLADDFYGSSSAARYLREVNAIPPEETPGEGAVVDVPVGDSDLERYERRTQAKVHYNRGILYADRGELSKAAEEFRSALRVDPRFADAGYNLGVTLLRSGDPVRAVSTLKQVAAVRPADPELLYALGTALVEAGRPEEAIQVFDDTIALDPRNEDALFSRAATLLDLGRADEGIFHLDAYVRAFPSGRWSDRARSMLSSLRANSGSGD